MALVDDYENAVKAGNTQLADYLAKAVAFQYGGINPANVTAAPASLLPTSSTNAPSLNTSDFLNKIMNWIDSIDPTSPMNKGMNPLTSSGIASTLDSAVSTASNTVSGASSAIAFITDIPRVTTTVLGLILIIAGIFALSQGAAARVIVNTLHSNATS